MLSVNVTRYYLFCLALCYICGSSNGEEYCDYDSDSCETSTLSASLGSTVLLPCSFGNKTSLSNLDWVSWVQNLDSNLVHLTSNGRIKFLDPRFGRVKAFPYQGNLSTSNFSIRIDDLQASDLGCYRCEKSDGCHQVEVSERGETSADLTLLVCITVGLAIFILLFGACWYCRVRNAHASTWPVENIEMGDKQERGANNNLPIYENNDHDPAIHCNDLTRNHLQLPGILPAVARNELTQSGNEHDPAKNEGNPAKRESQRRQGFHRELMRRLRQASLSRHYYVNQAQLNQQAVSFEMENRLRASFWRKKGKQKCRYENPIYSNSTEHLNNQY